MHLFGFRNFTAGTAMRIIYILPIPEIAILTDLLLLGDHRPTIEAERFSAIIWPTRRPEIAVAEKARVCLHHCITIDATGSQSD